MPSPEYLARQSSPAFNSLVALDDAVVVLLRLVCLRLLSGLLTAAAEPDAGRGEALLPFEPDCEVDPAALAEAEGPAVAVRCSVVKLMRDSSSSFRVISSELVGSLA